MGRLKAVAINQPAHSCGDGETEDPMPCCEDVSEELKVDEVSQVSFEFNASPDLFLLSTFQAILIGIEKFETERYLAFHDYSPPLPDLDIQVEHQVFLI